MYTGLFSQQGQMGTALDIVKRAKYCLEPGRAMDMASETRNSRKDTI